MSCKLDQRVNVVRLSFVEARSEIFVICRVANVPCWEESVESSFARTVFTVVCLRLFLVPAAGNVSVVGMILVALSAIEEVL